ncbi:hypothetical protein KY290_037011 [Solanum tuberosum]|uniref:Uncharacterized protein n=1 Tax=Solanum tuberosum TaxID=4113 RepID=A0ABQ7TUS5_SOLTU|nr:hypothetical protein KY289_036501 [Solanum tuberosum]KAH0738306.1 hypothetical protein KY290_037011 [Solanum tuberosum]
MKERTTSSWTEMQYVQSDSPIRAITCKADWPNAGDKWGWRAGKRLDDSFEAIAKRKRLASIGLFDIDFDSDMKERTTSSRTKLQSLLPDYSIRAITCMAVSLVYAEIVTVSFAAKLSVKTKMDTVTFDVKQQ